MAELSVAILAMDNYRFRLATWNYISKELKENC